MNIEDKNMSTDVLQIDEGIDSAGHWGVEGLEQHQATIITS